MEAFGKSLIVISNIYQGIFFLRTRKPLMFFIHLMNSINVFVMNLIKSFLNSFFNIVRSDLLFPNLINYTHRNNLQIVLENLGVPQKMTFQIELWGFRSQSLEFFLSYPKLHKLFLSKKSTQRFSLSFQGFHLIRFYQEYS